MPDPETPPPLPAPYVDPWLLLRRDLRAVSASLRLRLQEIWRRNRQGDLPRPGGWPASLAPWFWPLALALALLLLAGLTLTGRELLTRTPPVPEAAPAAAEAPPPPAAELVPPSGPVAAGPEPPEAAPPATEPSPEAQAQEAPPPPDPLREALEAAAEAGWIRAIEAAPASGRLELVLAPGFSGLDRSRQLRLADLWLQRSRELGYDSLTLTAPPAGLIARSARVGSGMILLSPTSAS